MNWNRIFFGLKKQKKTDFSLIGANGVNGSLLVPPNAHTQLTEYTLHSLFLSPSPSLPLAHTHSAKASIFSLICEERQKTVITHRQMNPINA